MDEIFEQEQDDQLQLSMNHEEYEYLLTMISFTNWCYDNVIFASQLGLSSLRMDFINKQLQRYFIEKGLPPDSRLTDGVYKEYLYTGNL